ncbi:MAG: hypothetical protein ACREA9_10820 [Pyrinomonadaceae bacterium]
MEVNSVASLNRLESLIEQVIQRYKLDQVLFGLRSVADDFEPFVIGGASLFAVRFCNAGRRSARVLVPGKDVLAPWLHLVTCYLLADPIGYDLSLQEEYKNANPVFAFLRIVGSQMPYSVSLFGHHAQPLLLYHDIPKNLAQPSGLRKFDFEESFRNLYGTSTREFINIGFTSSVAALSHGGFTRGYFRKAREQGIKLPTETKLLSALDRLAADPTQLRNLHRKYQATDPRFAMYGFNPLFLRPLVRPWRQKKHVSMDEDRMVAPIPNLVVLKNSVGIFYEMFNRYGLEFSNYFGAVFEAYVGRVLQHCGKSSELIAESGIREAYPQAKGKAPDWIVVEGNSAILVECKATRFSRAALLMGDESAINYSLKQVIKGLRQLADFREACLARTTGLGILHGCKTFKAVLVTLEPLYLINSAPFRRYIDDELTSLSVKRFPWRVLSVDELEKLQPYLAQGLSLNKALNDLESKTLDALLGDLYRETGLTFRDSFLYEMDRELYRRLGVRIILSPTRKMPFLPVQEHNAGVTVIKSLVCDNGESQKERTLPRRSRDLQAMCC